MNHRETTNHDDFEAEMKEQGIHIESAVSIFDQEARAVYVDSCCHYNPLGNEILAAFIVEEIDFKLPDWALSHQRGNIYPAPIRIGSFTTSQKYIM